MTHLPRCGPTGPWLLLASLLAVAACSSDGTPTAPRNLPEFDISDAAHQGGTPGFFFLPPLVALPTTTSGPPSPTITPCSRVRVSTRNRPSWCASELFFRSVLLHFGQRKSILSPLAAPHRVA